MSVIEAQEHEPLQFTRFSIAAAEAEVCSQLSQQSTGTTGAAAGWKAGCLQTEAARKMAV